MAKRNQSAENIQHLVSVRIRVKGTGNLKTTAWGYDGATFSNLPNVAMAATTNIQPTVLANFNEQKMQLEIKTTEINEKFTITRIIPFTKPLATSYPQ